MKYFQIMYNKIDTNVVIIVSDDDTMTVGEATDKFIRDYEEYDGVSSHYERNTDIISVDEISEYAAELGM